MNYTVLRQNPKLMKEIREKVIKAAAEEKPAENVVGAAAVEPEEA